MSKERKEQATHVYHTNTNDKDDDNDTITNDSTALLDSRKVDRTIL